MWCNERGYRVAAAKGDPKCAVLSIECVGCEEGEKMMMMMVVESEGVESVDRELSPRERFTRTRTHTHTHTHTTWRQCSNSKQDRDPWASATANEPLPTARVRPFAFDLRTTHAHARNNISRKKKGLSELSSNPNRIESKVDRDVVDADEWRLRYDGQNAVRWSRCVLEPESFHHNNQIDHIEINLCESVARSHGSNFGFLTQK